MISFKNIKLCFQNRVLIETEMSVNKACSFTVEALHSHVRISKYLITQAAFSSVILKKTVLIKPEKIN